MILTSFMENISESKFVHFDRENKLFFAWNGSQTVNVYSYRGDNIDVFMIDKLEDRDHYSVRDEIDEYIVENFEEEMIEEDDDE